MDAQAWIDKAQEAYAACDYASGLEYAKQAVELAPWDFTALSYLASFECKLGLGYERTMKKILAYNSVDAYSWSALGVSYGNAAEYEASRMCYDRAMELAYLMPELVYNSSLNHLLLGNWKEGWAQYQYGKLHGGRSDRFRGNEYDGQYLDGTLYVWHEQGLGDTINFIAPVAMRKLAKRVVVEVQEPLVELMLKALPNADQVYAPMKYGGAAEKFDAQCSTLDLAALAAPNGPANAGWVGEWAAKSFNTTPTKGKVAYCTKGSSGHSNDHNRSTTEADWEWVPPSWTDLTWKNQFVNMLQTAEAIKDCELIITVDTSLAHLAGAMGKPVWVLIPAVTDWRWGLKGTTAPWYKSMRLFRQERHGEGWSKVMQNIQEELKAISML